MEGTTLSDRGEQILAALRGQSEPITRSKIAALLGRPNNRLSQLDLEALAALEGQGKIEVERRPDARPAGFAAYYRVSQTHTREGSNG